MSDPQEDNADAAGSDGVVRRGADWGRRGRFAIIIGVSVAAVLIASLELVLTINGRHTDKARDCVQLDDSVCASVFDLVGPPGQLPSAAQIQAEFPKETIAASWTLGSGDSAVTVPAATTAGQYGVFAACLGGGTMTVEGASTAYKGSMTVACNGHMPMGMYLGVVWAGQSTESEGPFRFAVTTTGVVSAAEYFVLSSL